MEIQKLEENLRFHGFDYFLVERNEIACIYEQKIDEETRCYEVFKNKTIDQYRIAKAFGTPRPKLQYREVFPKDEDFGYRAWTYKTIEDAKKKYEQITDKVKRNDYK